MERNIYLVIQTSSCPDMERGEDSTSIEIGFTVAASKKEAEERYPSRPYGARCHVLAPDEFFEFSVPEGPW